MKVEADPAQDALDALWREVVNQAQAEALRRARNTFDAALNGAPLFRGVPLAYVNKLDTATLYPLKPKRKIISAGRARQIAAMKKYWAKRRAQKGRGK